MRGKYTIILSSLALFVIFLIPCLSSAQTTGSIGGVVTDANDGSPLSGAVIKIENSNLGAITDENGQFVILNLQVGNYDVTASYIGYAPQRQKGVKVSVDVRTTVDFVLGTASDSTFTTGPIDVVADRRGIDIEQSGRTIGEEQIENQGRHGLQNIVSTTAGVVSDERGNNLNIRGGRSNENNIIVDGVATTNPINGGSTAFVPNSLLQEIAVLTGGFGAEYGNALSGVIIATTKGGTSYYSGSVEAITDEFAGDWIKTTSQGYNLYNVSLGGPLFPTKGLSKVINFYGAVERQYLAVQGPSWIADQLFESGRIPNYNQKIWSYSGRLNFNFDEIKNSKIPIQLRLGALVTDNNRRRLVQSNLYTNDARNPLEFIRDNQFYGRISHSVSNKFFYELQGNYYSTKDELGDAYFMGNWFAYGDTNSNPGLATNGGQGNVFGSDPNTGSVFALGGRVFNSYIKTDVSYIGSKLDATWALQTKKYGNHELKFGGEYRYHTLHKIDFGPAAIADNPIDSSTGLPTQDPVKLWFGRDVLLNSYGYDVRDQYGNQIVSDEDVNPKHPIIADAYLRDKVDFGDFTFNGGVRLDYLDVNTDVLIDPKNLLHGDGLLLTSDDYAPSKADILISPRLGFSFPVTDKTVFVAQYGKFVQMPPLDFLYINKFAFQSFFSNSVQNVAENSALHPEKLTSYEVGFKQQVSDLLDFGITAYYRETKDQIGITRITGSPTVPIGYAIFYNSDFSISRGLDFYLSLKRMNRLSADISYTLLFASGVGSDPNTKFALANNSDGELPVFAFPLDYDQRHTGTINLDYRFGSTDVPKGFGGEILKNLGLNVLFSFNSGRPYTQRELPKTPFADDGNSLSTKNQVYRDWTTRFDLKLDKSINIWKTNLNLYVYVINLLNTEIVNNVYGSTGLPGDNGYLNTQSGSGSSELYKENFEKRIKTLTNWGPPRQIRFGAKISF